MGFGLATTDDDQIIAVGGHDFSYETMTNVAILDTRTENFQWKNLPDMPSKTFLDISKSICCYSLRWHYRSWC
jgi:hypothetical protein